MDIKPGIYEDVSFGDYVSWDAINNGCLKQMRKSPAHYYAARQGLLHHDSDALTFGRLVHNGQLEPGTLLDRYAYMPAYHLDENNVTADGKPSKSKGTTYYKNKASAFEQANEDKEIVSVDWYREMCRLIVAVSHNDLASKLFNERGRTELSICWEDRRTGLLCKARIDKELAESGGQVDLKTCSDPGEFNWHIWKFGYHHQAAWYREGWSQVTGEEPAPFYLCAVGPKDSDLCTCLCAPVSDDLLRIGGDENIATLEDVRFFTEKNEWPNYEQPKEWTGPAHKVAAALEPALEWE